MQRIEEVSSELDCPSISVYTVSQYPVQMHRDKEMMQSSMRCLSVLKQFRFTAPEKLLACTPSRTGDPRAFRRG